MATVADALLKSAGRWRVLVAVQTVSAACMLLAVWLGTSGETLGAVLAVTTIGAMTNATTVTITLKLFRVRGLDYLRVLARLSWVRIAVAALLPLTAIVTALALLNVEHAVFDLMSGTTRADPHGAAYFVVLLLAFGSIHIFPLALLGWLWIWYQDMRARRLHGNAAEEK